MMSNPSRSDRDSNTKDFKETLKMRRKSIWILALLVMMAALLASCATAEGKEETIGTVLAETDERAVNGLFDIKGLGVVSYRVRGEGPDGAWFDWVESDSPRIALADVRRGLWTIYAQGLNRYGEPVVQGKLETFLSEDSPVDNLIFDEQYGTGDIRSALAWNPVQVMHPAVEVYLRADDGEYMARPADEITIGNGTAIWSAHGIPSGSYIARFVLRDGSSPVSGAAAAVRVIDDATSVGQVRMTIGDLSQVYGIELLNIPVDTLKGHLELAGGHVSYISESEASGVIYDWFIDGSFMESREDHAMSLETLRRGYHRIDCVARTSDYGSISSVSIHVYADGVGGYAEVSEAEVNAAIEEFEATAENENALKLGLAEAEEAAAETDGPAAMEGTVTETAE